MKKVLTVTMDGIRYHASRPANCRDCFFWKNRKKGCVLGKENCYYLIEPPKGPSKCDGCPYKRVKPCVLVPCYLRLGKNLNQRDTIVVRKIVGGYVKLLYPDEAYTKSQIGEILVFALEMRRVKEQLKKLGGMEF